MPPLGSIEDRVLRETVFRERQERVSHLDAVSKIAAQLFNLDAHKFFGHVVRDYAREVFQETYDAELLRQKLEALRRAQDRIRVKRSEELREIGRLDRMGQYYDKVMGPLPFEKKPVVPPKSSR